MNKEILESKDVRVNPEKKVIQEKKACLEIKE